MLDDYCTNRQFQLFLDMVVVLDLNKNLVYKWIHEKSRRLVDLHTPIYPPHITYHVSLLHVQDKGKYEKALGVV